MKNRGQQEILGFVLIVVMVVVGMMVFLVISLRNSPETKGSLEVGNLLDAVMRDTTECAIIYEPDYDSFEDLFKSCYQGDSCSNLNRPACDYLNESLKAVIDDLMKSEADVSFYQIDFFAKDSGENSEILKISKGNCTGNMHSAQRSIVSVSDVLIVRMRMCKVLG